MLIRSPTATAHTSNKEGESDAKSYIAPPPINQEIIAKLNKKSIARTMGEMWCTINKSVRPLRGYILQLLGISLHVSASEFETLLPPPSLPKNTTQSV